MHPCNFANAASSPYFETCRSTNSSSAAHAAYILISCPISTIYSSKLEHTGSTGSSNLYNFDSTISYPFSFSIPS